MVTLAAIAGVIRNVLWTRTNPHAFLFSPYGAGSRRHLDERFSAPEVLKPIRSQLGVTHRVLDVLVAEPRLQCPGVMAGIGQRVAAAVPQHVRVDLRGLALA